MSPGFFLILMATLVSATDRSHEIQSYVKAYYDSLLTGKVVSYEITMKRCPRVSTDRFRIIGIHGDENDTIPRGTRLCWVDVSANGKVKTIPVTLMIKTVERLPIARCDIPPRTALSDSLIEWRVMALDNLGAARILTEHEIDGLWTKVRITAGSVLTMPRLAPVPSVEIGEELTLVVRNGLVEVKTRGRALEDGYTGQIISVMIKENKKKLKGMVKADGKVVVE